MLTVYITKLIVIVYYLINKREHRKYYMYNYILDLNSVVIYDCIYLFIFKYKTGPTTQPVAIYMESVSSPV